MSDTLNKLKCSYKEQLYNNTGNTILLKTPENQTLVIPWEDSRTDPWTTIPLKLFIIFFSNPSVTCFFSVSFFLMRI